MISEKPGTFIEQNILFRQQFHPSLSMADPFPVMDLNEHYQLHALWRDYASIRIAFPKSVQFAEAISYFVDAQCPYFRPQPSPLLLRRATNRLNRIWREDLKDSLPLHVLKSSADAMEETSKLLYEWFAVDPDGDEVRQQEMFGLLGGGGRHFLWHAHQEDTNNSLVLSGFTHRAVVNEMDGLLESLEDLMADMSLSSSSSSSSSSSQLSADYIGMYGDRDRRAMKFSNDEIRRQKPDL